MLSIMNEDIKKLLIYETRLGGMVELCFKNLTSLEKYKFEIYSYRGIYRENVNTQIDYEKVNQALDSSLEVLRKGITNLDSIIKEKEMEYIINKPFTDKLIDSLLWKK